ncbi:MAG TPA: bifunctional precorrin-2 dehydrogenase/sirohydrochlorin ferrochelatase [Terriglobia bacterium]|nr:bifunctional precorrin-2 dehydrogenase/sirohydrochlorin ferrochelatase [Terriglobia bacterium]
MYYPVFINLQGRSTLVVGGGAVAERKVETLVEAGARVTVVAPEATPRLLEWSAAGTVTLKLKPFEDSDVDGHWLVVAATDDPATQQAAHASGARRHVLVNVVDQPDLCDFIVPSIARRGDVVVAVSTSGQSPALAAALRARIEGMLPDDVARVARVLGSLREEARCRLADAEERKRAFERVIASGILDWIREYDDAGALTRARRLMGLDAGS